MTKYVTFKFFIILQEVCEIHVNDFNILFSETWEEKEEGK